MHTVYTIHLWQSAVREKSFLCVIGSGIRTYAQAFLAHFLIWLSALNLYLELQVPVLYRQYTCQISGRREEKTYVQFVKIWQSFRISVGDSNKVYFSTSQFWENSVYRFGGRKWRSKTELWKSRLWVFRKRRFVCLVFGALKIPLKSVWKYSIRQFA